MPLLRLLFAGVVAVVVVVGGLIAAAALFVFALVARLFGVKAGVRVHRNGVPPRPSARAARQDDAIDVESSVVKDDEPPRRLP